MQALEIFRKPALPSGHDLAVAVACVVAPRVQPLLSPLYLCLKLCAPSVVEPLNACALFLASILESLHQNRPAFGELAAKPLRRLLDGRRRPDRNLEPRWLVGEVPRFELLRSDVPVFAHEVPDEKSVASR